MVTLQTQTKSGKQRQHKLTTVIHGMMIMSNEYDQQTLLTPADNNNKLLSYNKNKT